MLLYPSAGGRRLLYSTLWSGKDDMTVQAASISALQIQSTCPQPVPCKSLGLGGVLGRQVPPIPGSLGCVAQSGLPRGNLMVPCCVWYGIDLSRYSLPMIRTACLPRFFSMSLDVAPVPVTTAASANRFPAECLSWECPKLSPLNHFVGIDRPLEVFLKSG